MNAWTARQYFPAIFGALLLGFFVAWGVSEPPQPVAFEQPRDEVWRIPQSEDAQGAQISRRIIVRAPFERAELLEDDGRNADVDAAQHAAEAAVEARREANTWRFVGTVEEGGQLQAVFRAGDGRVRRALSGEIIEGDARLIELDSDRVLIELPASLRGQLGEEVSSEPIRLQLFRDTGFSLFIEPDEPK